jgi:dienelactone hydrolase
VTSFSQAKGLLNPGGAPNEKVTLITHRLHKWDGSKRAVVLLPGHNGDALTVMAQAAFLVGNQRLGDVAAAMDLALPVLAIDGGGGQTFGNDTAIARIADAVAWIAATGYGKTDKVILAGTSMGSTAGVNYAARNPSKVAALALFYPAMDLQWTRDNAGYTAEVDGAYGGSAGFTAAVASHSPTPQAASGALGSLPIKGWHASADSVVGPATWAAFKSALAAAGSPPPGDYDLGGASHGDNTQVPAADVAAFYAAHA